MYRHIHGTKIYKVGPSRDSVDAVYMRR